jgi:signal transduction histidine kinase
MPPDPSPKHVSQPSVYLKRLGWVTISLFIVPYLLVIAWFSVNLWSVSQPFVRLFSEYPSFIRFTTAVLSAICALFFFLPREGTRLVGRWSNYVGLAFVTLSVQYAVRFTQLQLEGLVSSAAEAAFSYISLLAIYVCSAANNLLFLAAARSLLNRNMGEGKSRPLRGHDEIFVQFRDGVHNTFAKFRSVVPAWALSAALVTPIVALFDAHPGFPWARFPDAIFSAYCLCWFGYAVAINLNVRRRVVLSALALSISLLYGAGQLIWATNPIVAYAAQPNSSSTFPLPWIREMVGREVYELATEMNRATGRADGPEVYLDSAVFVTFLPLRFGLFVVAFTLYLLFLVSLNDFRRALNETTNRRKDYLSADGIVKAIGDSLGASRASLFIRIPGSQKTKVLSLVWSTERNDMHPEAARELPLEEEPLLMRVMEEGAEEILVSPTSGANGANDTQATEFPSLPLLLVPVKFQGGVIGGVQVELGGYDKFNFTTLQKFRLMAQIIAPAVQDFRALAAIDQIGFRLARLHVDYPKGGFVESTKRIAEVLHDVLTPLATGLTIEIGFSQIRHACAGDGAYTEVLKELVSVGREGGIQVVKADANISLESRSLLVRVGSQEEERHGQASLSIGRLTFAIPAERDEISRPTLAGYHLSRKVVASLTADGVLDFARDFLGMVIKDLGVDLNKEDLSQEEWLAAISSAARRAGLSWVAVTDGCSEEPRGVQTLVHVPPYGLGEEERSFLLKQPLSTIATAPYEISAHHVIRLKLSESKRWLWLGVARHEFGPELDFESPWKGFLHDLAEVADAALGSIQKRHEAEAENLNAAMSQGVMAIAVTTGTLMHQLLNMIRDQLFATEALEEELADSGAELNARSATLLRAMRNSAGQMRELTEAFKSVTAMDGRRPCSLRSAAEQAVRLFQVSLMQRKIKVNINIPAETVADIPFYVAAFAMANLISNARDAIWYDGTIGIEVEEDKDSILCHVTNDGPEIPPEVQSSLFRFGSSSKPGHNGWGLYFVDKSLRESGGSIALAYSEPAATRFTIRLPRERNN